MHTRTLDKVQSVRVMKILNLPFYKNEIISLF